MNWWNFNITSLIIFIFIFFIIIIILWVYTLKRNIPIPAAPQYTLAGYGMRCIPNNAIPTFNSKYPYEYAPQHCEESLECVMNENFSKEWGYCKKKLGIACTDLYECVPEANICFGYCSKSDSGDLNQPCIAPDFKCSEGLICDKTIENPNIGTCVIPDGEKGCLVDSNCTKNARCINNFCIVTLPNGGYCEINSQCESFNCSKNYCQKDGLETGTVDAICAVNLRESPLPPCNANLNCYYVFKENVPVDVNHFKGSPSAIYGHCIQNFNWPSSNCESGCIPPSLCYKISDINMCILPRLMNGNVPTNEPNINSCSDIFTSGICIPGYTCVSEYCEATKGMPSKSLSYGLVEWIKSDAFGHWEFKMNIDFKYSNLSLLSSNNDLYIYHQDETEITSREMQLRGYKLLNTFIIYKYKSYQLSCRVIPDVNSYNIGGNPSCLIRTIRFTPNNNVSIFAIIKLDNGKRFNYEFYQPIPDRFYSPKPLLEIKYPSELIEGKFYPKSPIVYNLNLQIITIPYDVFDIIIDDNLIDNKCRILYLCTGGYNVVNVVYTGYFTGNNNSISYINTEPIIKNIQPQSQIAIPYNVSKFGDNLGSYIYSKNKQLEININYEPLKEYERNYVRPPYIEDTTYSYTVTKADLKSNNGNTLDQIKLVYLIMKNNVYYLRYMSSNLDVMLPGYFFDNTLISISKGNNNRLALITQVK